MIEETPSPADPALTTAKISPLVRWSNFIMFGRQMALIISGGIALLKLLSRHQIAEAWAFLQSDAGTNFGTTLMTVATPAAIVCYGLWKNTKLHAWMAGLVYDPRVRADVVNFK